MLRAHADGLIDYARYDPDDKLWKRRHRMVLSFLDDRIASEVVARHHDQSMAVLSTYSGQSLNDACRRTDELMRQWHALQTPWAADEVGGTPEERAARLYDRTVGVPGEPRYEEAMAQLDRELQPLTKAEKLRRRRVQLAREAATIERRRVVVAG